MIFAELPSIRTTDAFRSPIRRAGVEQEIKALGGSGPDMSRKPIMTGHALVRGPASPRCCSAWWECLR